MMHHFKTIIPNWFLVYKRTKINLNQFNDLIKLPNYKTSFKNTIMLNQFKLYLMLLNWFLYDLRHFLTSSLNYLNSIATNHFNLYTPLYI